MRTFAQRLKAAQQTESAKSTISGRAHFGQSRNVNSILQLQRTIGNQTVQRLLQANAEEPAAGSTLTPSSRFAYDFSRVPLYAKAQPKIQAQLAVSTPGDMYEQEADRMAERVMRIPDPALAMSRLVAAVPGDVLQRKCTQCTEKEEHHLQRKVVGALPAATTAPRIVHEVLRSPGQPLDVATRRFMEPRFGHNFDHVRIHADALASRSAEAVAARAYTVGSSIAFRLGEYAPETPKGRRLLAHELAHVVQQRATGGEYLAMARTLQRQPDSQDQETDQTALQCGVRTVQLPSPGTSSNYVVLKSGPKVAEGIVFITNVGKCQVFIHGTDASGRALDQTNPLTLNPGEYAFQFVPPPKSVMIIAITSKGCSDDSAISYDPCAGIV